MHMSQIEAVFNTLNEKEFNNLALSTFYSQYQNNLVYRAFSQSLKINPDSIDHYSKIPFLPIGFFKSHDVICNAKKDDFIVFTSSSTTGQTPSRHIVSDIEIYKKSFIAGFERFYGKPSDYAIIALLPNYLERKGSSLVYMFNELIRRSEHPLSSFFADDHDKIMNEIQSLKKENKKTILIGVSYALLDLADKNIKLNDNFIVMETGGMKGKREELLKEELHQILKQKFGVSTIHSEYGMTELLSQAYSKGDGLFDCPPWMKVLVRDTEDPLNYVTENKTGGLNIIDLANINSCSFIATQDLGRLKAGEQFELLGRFDNSDIRGCNLLVN